MKIINLTPHDIVIIRDGVVAKRYPPSGKVAKLTEQDVPTRPLDGFPVARKRYGQTVLLDRADFLSKAPNPATEEFPPEQEGIVYLVPMLVGQMLGEYRNDLYGPDFGIGGVRTADGSVSGASGFIKY